MLGKFKSFINKPIKININIHNKYSWNVLSVFGFFELFFIIAMGYNCPTCGTPIHFILILLFYPITFIIFLVIILTEYLKNLSIKKEVIVNSKKYKILRYIGLTIWFLPLVSLVIFSVLDLFLTY